jgi:hypothetical protein
MTAAAELPTDLYYASGQGQSGADRLLHTDPRCHYLQSANNTTRCPASNPPRGSVCDVCAPRLTRADLIGEPVTDGGRDVDEWSFHHRVFYRLVVGAAGGTTRELSLLYDALAPLLYQGVMEDPVSSRRWRRTLLDELRAAGMITAAETPRGHVWLPAETVDDVEDLEVALEQTTPGRRAVTDGGRDAAPIVGAWPTADAVAQVAEPVVAADGAGEHAAAPGAARDACELCGADAAAFALALEWPPESDADPGWLAGTVCGDCAGAWAMDLLATRMFARAVDVFEGLP